MTEIWDIFGSGNGLLPDGTKPLTEPILTYHVRSCGIHLRAILQEMFKEIYPWYEFENF